MKTSLLTLSLLLSLPALAAPQKHPSKKTTPQPWGPSAMTSAEIATDSRPQEVIETLQCKIKQQADEIRILKLQLNAYEGRRDQAKMWLDFPDLYDAGWMALSSLGNSPFVQSGDNFAVNTKRLRRITLVESDGKKYSMQLHPCCQEITPWAIKDGLITKANAEALYPNLAVKEHE